MSRRRYMPSVMSVMALTGVIFISLPWEKFLDAGVSLTGTLALPSRLHPLGTDNLGRDLLVRLSLVWREAVLPLWGMTLGASVLGTLAGLASIRWGEKFTAVIALLSSLFTAVPVALVVFFIAAWNEAAGLGPVLLGLTPFVALRCFFAVFELYVRDSKLGYWQAHAANGGTTWQRLWSYGLLGHWRQTWLDLLGLHLRMVVTIEASLAYLGFGVQEPMPSFGNILASHFEGIFRGEWWVLVIVIAAYALTMLVPVVFASIRQPCR